MDNIAQRLKAYIDTHPIDLGDSDCEPSWISYARPTRKPTKVTHPRSATASKNWKIFSVRSHWMTTMPSLTSAAACAALMSERLLSMA